MHFADFRSWSEVINAVRQGVWLYYHAPLDVRPVPVHCSVRGKNPRKVRVDPMSKDADAFWADSGHLDRLRKRLPL